MDAHEIVVHEVDRHHVSMVHGLLREGIRQPRQRNALRVGSVKLYHYRQTG